MLSGNSARRLGAILVVLGATTLVLGPARRTLADPVCDVLWTFNGATSGTADATGNGNNGTLNVTGTGSLTYTGPTNFGGVTQQAAQFIGDGSPGNTAGVGNTAANNLPLASTDSWTLNTWMNMSSPPAFYTFLSGFGSVNGPVGYNRGMIDYGSGFYSWGYGGSADLDSGKGYKADSAWHMYTITYNGAGSISMYIDANLINAGAVTLKTAAATNLYVAGDPPGSGAPNTYTGQMADFSVWTGALSQPQLTYLASNAQATSVAAAPQPTVWTGAFNSEWSTANIPSPKNWTIGGTAADYANGQDVQFDDSAGLSGGTTTVAISGTGNVTPNTVTFNNSAYNYTLQGPYGISGPATLSKTGSGLLTITNSNDYSGNTIVSSGTLILANQNAVHNSTVFAAGGGLVFESSVSGACNIGGLAGNGGITLQDSATPTPNPVALTVGGNNANTIYNGILSGSGSLTKVGSGTLALGGPNTYSGGTTINDGTLSLSFNSGGGPGGTLAAGALVTVNSGATLNVNTTDALGYYSGSPSMINLMGTLTIGGGIHANLGPLTMTGGTLTSAGGGDGVGNYIINSDISTNASAVPSVISANSIQIRGPGNAGATGQVTFAVARGSGPVDLLVSSRLTGNDATSGFIKAGPGIMVLSNYNIYTGGTTVNGGTLSLAAGGPNGTLAAGTPVTINPAGTLNLTTEDALGYYGGFPSVVNLLGTLTTVGGTHANLGPLNMTSGTLTSAGPDDGYGSYIIDDNVVTNANGAIPSVINANSLSLRGPGNAGATGQVTFTVARGTGLIDLLVSSNLSGVGPNSGLIKAGPGVMVLSGNIGYTGGTSVSGGTLALDLSAQSGGVYIGAVDVGATEMLALYNTATDTDNLLLHNATFTGSGTITKIGPGYLTIHDGSSIAGFTGKIDVQEGTLSINDIGAAASAGQMSMHIAPGAVLDDRYNSLLAMDTLSGSGILTHSYYDSLTVSIGNNNGSSTFDGAITDQTTAGFGPLALSKVGDGTLTLTGINTYTGGTNVVGGTLILASSASILDGTTLTVGADAATIFGLSAGNAAGMASLTTSAVVPVPEPGTLTLLLGAGMAAGLGFRRKKNGWFFSF